MHLAFRDTLLCSSEKPLCVQNATRFTFLLEAFVRFSDGRTEIARDRLFTPRAELREFEIDPSPTTPATKGSQAVFRSDLYYLGSKAAFFVRLWFVMPVNRRHVRAFHNRWTEPCE